MNDKIFSSMQSQLVPSPQVRAALSEKLARPVKKRPVPRMKYAALAACAALAIGGLSVYGLRQNPQAWMLITRNFRHSAEVLPLHSYVMMDGVSGYTTEDAGVNDKENGEDTGAGAIEILPAPNTGDLPGGAYIGDAPVPEASQAQDKLYPHVRSNPDWYGGMYIDDTGTLVVCLVEGEDPGDKSLELQVLEWTGSDRVVFTDVKYSLAHLDKLMDRLNHLPEDPKCYDVMASWARDERNNRVVVTLTEANDYILSLLAELDPDDDAIYVQVGQRATFDVATDEVVSADSANTENPAVHHVMPGGATVPDDEDLIADEPYYDGAHYDVLPAELPEQKQPAFVETDSVPEEDASTASYDPNGK